MKNERKIECNGRLYLVKKCENPCGSCILGQFGDMNDCICEAARLNVLEYIAEDLGPATPSDSTIGRIVDLFKESITKGEPQYIEYIKSHWKD